MQAVILKASSFVETEQQVDALETYVSEFGKQQEPAAAPVDIHEELKPEKASGRRMLRPYSRRLAIAS